MTLIPGFADNVLQRAIHLRLPLSLQFQRATRYLKMLYDELDINSCLRLLGMEIQREGKLITWSSSNLESGIRRWVAIYEYEGNFYGQSTDAGQTGPYS